MRAGGPSERPVAGVLPHSGCGVKGDLGGAKAGLAQAPPLGAAATGTPDTTAMATAVWQMTTTEQSLSAMCKASRSQPAVVVDNTHDATVARGDSAR